MVMLIASAARAEVRASLPLEGAYRTGRYMPVRLVVTNEAGSEITLRARGALPTQLALSGGKADAVIPLLTTSSSVSDVRWSGADGVEHALDLRMRALGDDERLVALAGADPASARALFPDKKVIAVPLDVTRPLL